MLSKSQARAFFVGGTVVFSAVFLWLTVDTISQVPERSNQDRMTEEVVHGKEIWERNNCMGCHTILGEGAYYAPELTRSYERRGPVWLKIFLKDPEAMFPGRRKMVNYHFNDEELDAVIAFLKWIGEIDTNGFPAEPDLKPPAPPPTDPRPLLAQGASPHVQRPEVVDQLCLACHSVGGKGQQIGPAFDGVARRYDAEALDQWLADPQAVKPGTAMPNLNLDDATRASLVAWLMTLE